ncbi:pyridoxal phosphate-dependent aminotransferase [Alcaligenes faecalis]|jgi:aspartate/methionine/tyrosine aminotransferase|uniref:Pyridoxal phosphate-dependent aminotransferase n=1 Tax=Alcaligenes faecalis TaxID=511 RepID=A0ABY7N6Q8_ALCFA|nr:pyridoxal phosphate-dependent aminotransferase [Alcaligenes faecalis]MBX6965664.1 pyridoxal phosphate-dependent aminotransferase [Providencia rettgeri]MBX7032100.1 pyridoxal phosphate-dependent aminotransferase [Alcaligenes faecalis]QFY76841.1 pyridoxal phosphate-dependent aminotransferase [Alcaligenes faecalis]WBM39063.1 pyridoxal phosphate-dependent aminotransferase [Alcaligenes faecalis]
MSRLASRTEHVLPFHAVELFKQANALKATGRDIISLGIGEPDFTAPQAVVDALHQASNQGLSQYTAPAGLTALRERIALYYEQQFQARVDPSRIVVTAGASGALSLATLALINPGDEVLMPDPSYPANQNFIMAAGGTARLIPASAEERFQLSAQHIREHWGPKTRGVLIASPNNPTGATISRPALQELIKEVRARDGFIIMDEIYLGLFYEEAPLSALTLDQDIIVINSFSKYFHMTGWRLGWLILPTWMTEVCERMAASLAICAPSLAQHAALACFEPDTMAIYEERRLAFKQRRDYLLPELERLGLRVPVRPDGAFYIYTDIREYSQDSDAFSQQLLHEAGVAAVPGRDFGTAHAPYTLRLSYATGMDRLQEAISRLGQFLGR